MAHLPKEMADEVGKSRTSGGGNYIQHGNYIFMIDKWFYQKIQDRCIILENATVESKKKVVYEGQKKVEQEPNAVGSTCSATANFDGEGKLSAPSNARAPVLGLFGLKENEVPDAKVSETLSYVCADPTPARGMLLACSTFPKEVRSRKGNYITGLAWECVSKPGEGVNAPDLVKARLEAWARSPEEAIKLAQQHLQAARSTGAVQAAPTEAASQQAEAAPTPAAQTQAAPPAPPAPSAPAIPAAPQVDPVEAALAKGWQRHPTPGWFFLGQVVKSEADIRAGQY